MEIFYPISCIGMIFSIIQIFLNFRIVLRYLLSSSTWKKNDFKLITARTILDIIVGLVAFTLFLVTMLCDLLPDIVPSESIFYVGLLASNIAIVRGLLAASIAIERSCAIVFPLHFKQYRKVFTNLGFLTFFIFFAIFDDFMLLYVFDMEFPLKSDCRIYACFIPRSYAKYETIIFLIISLITYFFSIFLSINMLIKYYRSVKLTNDMLKVNLLCITDLICQISFEFIPALIVQVVRIQNNVGPLMALLRSIGRVVEALSIFQLMRKNGSYGSARLAWETAS
ncbi:unnamed protein product [Caenorhabditis angaria]|uniref:Serpentine Receptor, class BC (Class B-like) n=1 Tax=Caenorhabditis angaria TaxID=860376 RepID=A0A9P1IQ45_9PELO|nr:unnamed protein product [Caenorhabditis angaria]